ncbi:MAG: hypothetical protein H6Q59_3496 [Firmicutes bacterium]|nr:hypothetical protein [Bacillota bacterium]
MLYRYVISCCKVRKECDILRVGGDNHSMSELFEAFMVVCFGISWPVSIYKSYTSRTAKGKSLFFMVMILVGYGFGIASKLLSGRITYVFIFYIINSIMVAIDILLYFRNKQLDLGKESRSVL